MKFFCKKCSIVISSDLTELKDLSLINESDGEALIPGGYFLISDGSYYSLFQDNQCIYSTKGKYVINKDDLMNWRYHPDKRRVNGCCGCDGLDGINVVCKNGHEIGILKSDCWMPHGFIMEPDNTESKENEKW
jgi:hypothetical protein